jgi:hypothetical protein
MVFRISVVYLLRIESFKTRKYTKFSNTLSLYSIFKSPCVLSFSDYGVILSNN